MSYKLKFIPTALKEWTKLDKTIKNQFKKKIETVLNNPKVPANALSGFQNVYKIKLRSLGYRLVYEVIDDEICIMIITVGKRDTIYKFLSKKK